MSEPTYPGDAPAHDRWSQVYTGLDWVARWMADRGYTDAEIGYVVGQPAVPHVAVEPTPGPVEVPVEVPAQAWVVTEQTAWTVPLEVADGDPADQGEDEPADIDDEDTESPEQVIA